MRRSTTVPGWWALWVLIKYRSSRNFRSGAYLGARLGVRLGDRHMYVCVTEFVDIRVDTRCCPTCNSWSVVGSSPIPTTTAGDKCLFGFVLATLWWQLGGDYSASNAFNIAGILNFWVTMPAFGCAYWHVHSRSAL